MFSTGIGLEIFKHTVKSAFFAHASINEKPDDVAKFTENQLRLERRSELKYHEDDHWGKNSCPDSEGEI